MQQIGRYQVLEEIARGGMGVVYRVHDPASRRDVAIKVMLGGGSMTTTASKRFDREAKALARVDHTHVVRIFDYDVTPRGQPYMVMELIEGESLQRRLDRAGPYGPLDAVEAASQICSAVVACHAAGVLHRDLKPENVLLTQDGILKLTDFGLVRDADPSTSGTQLSKAGQYLGTPGYWAPEQACGDLDAIGPATDVYGLGATLFALLTGQPPHVVAGLDDLLRLLDRPPPAPSSLRRDVPSWLDKVVLRCLQVEPADRFESVHALGLALRAGPPEAVRPARYGAVAAALCLGGLLAASAIVWASRPPQREESAQAGETAQTPRAAVTATESDPHTPAAVDPPSPTPASKQPPDEALRAQELATRGEERYRAGAWPEARRLLDRAIALDPALATAYADRALVRASLGDWAGVISDYDQAIRLQPDDAGHFLNRGIALGNTGNPAKALSDYAESIRLDPKIALARYYRGLALYALGDYASAREAFSAAIRLDPDYSLAYYTRAVAFGRSGDFRSAAADYTESLRLEPDNPACYFERGVVRMELREFQGAIDDLSQAIRLQPDYPSAHFTRAVARGELGDSRGAIEDFDEAIRVDPRDVDAYVNRGVGYWKQGDFAPAISDFERALAIDPSNASARRKLVIARQSLAEEQG